MISCDWNLISFTVWDVVKMIIHKLDSQFDSSNLLLKVNTFIFSQKDIRKKFIIQYDTVPLYLSILLIYSDTLGLD